MSAESIIGIIFAIFAAIGAVDFLIGNKLGLGDEFKKGIHMLGEITIAMLGMIVLSPLFGHLLSAPLSALYGIIPIDPSSFIGSLLACDMGGAPLSWELAVNKEIGYFNGLVVGSMMGATVSFTLPFVMGAVNKAQRKNVLLGLLCGICTLPVGCFVGGLMCGIAPLLLLLNLSPLIILAIILALGIIFIPQISVKIFNVFGIVIRAIVIFGLTVGILEFLGADLLEYIGIDLIPHTDKAVTLEGVGIIFNIACVMAGAFPILHILSTLTKKPLAALAKKTGMNETSILGFISSLATSAPTFGMMKDMDDKGVVINSAFAVSGAFILADHLAYTLSYRSEYLFPVIAGKVVSAALAVVLAAIIYKKTSASEKKAVK